MTPEAFEHIAQRLRPLQQSVGKRFYMDNDKAEDVAQEVLMRLWLMRNRIDLDKDITALAIRMAKNYCVSEWRKQRVVSLEETESNISVENNDDAKETFEKLNKALSRLPLSEQRLFRMRYEWDLSIAEISAITEIAPRSVSSILSGAKRKLFEQLRKGGLL